MLLVFVGDRECVIRFGQAGMLIKTSEATNSAAKYYVVLSAHEEKAAPFLRTKLAYAPN